MVLFELAKDIQLLFRFGGTFPSRTRLLNKHYCILKTMKARSSFQLTVIINYCAAITAMLGCQITTDPHPMALCMTDSICTNNWTMYTSKKSIIRCALARFFCRLLIGSDVGITAKWISTLANCTTNKISRIKRSTNNPSSFQYDFSKLQQDHTELKHCCFFQPSQELLSMIWEILLMQNWPELSKVL
jgi:hypothetical protein